MNQWISEYQCYGCSMCYDDCYEPWDEKIIACKNHNAGTLMSNAGIIFLGLPKGFCRIGPVKNMIIEIFKNFDGMHYDKFNIPVWKYKNENNHVIVRGIRPRLNQPFLHIFLENCIDKIKCLEIYDIDINLMD